MMTEPNGQPEEERCPAGSGETLRCPKCGKLVRSLVCGHCGSQLPPWQADLYGAAIRQLARMGGDRADTGNRGGNPNGPLAGERTAEGPEGDDDQPRDIGGASTPPWLFDQGNQLAIQACGEPITLDVAATLWNTKCERYYTKEVDGSKQEWNAKAAWCNPPFSPTIIEMFVLKAIEAVRHGTTTVCVLPWWNRPYLDLCEQHGRIHRISSQVTFQRQDGTTTTLNSRYGTSPLVLVVFGPTITPGLGAPIRREDRSPDAPPGGDHIVHDGKLQWGMAERPFDRFNQICRSTPARNGDEYYTPPEAVAMLLPYLPKRKTIWECAWGKGHLAGSLLTNGLSVVGAPTMDFLTETPQRFDVIVSNPPFSLKNEFLQRAYSFGKPFAFLLPTDALVGLERSQMFQAHGLQLLIPNRRIQFICNSQTTCNFNTMWFCWRLLPRDVMFAELP